MSPLKQAMFYMKGPYNTLIALTFCGDRHGPAEAFSSHRSIETAFWWISTRQWALQEPIKSWQIQEVYYIRWLVEVITLAWGNPPPNSLDELSCSLPVLSLSFSISIQEGLSSSAISWSAKCPLAFCHIPLPCDAPFAPDTDAPRRPLAYLGNVGA